MIIRAPVIGLRCLIAGPTNGRVAMLRLLRISDYLLPVVAPAADAAAT
jgi:hypothetical protein